MLNVSKVLSLLIVLQLLSLPSVKADIDGSLTCHSGSMIPGTFHGNNPAGTLTDGGFEVQVDGVAMSVVNTNTVDAGSHTITVTETNGAVFIGLYIWADSSNALSTSTDNSVQGGTSWTAGGSNIVCNGSSALTHTGMENKSQSTGSLEIPSSGSITIDVQVMTSFFSGSTYYYSRLTLQSATPITDSPTLSPTSSPTTSPTGSPTRIPTSSPTRFPTANPTNLAVTSSPTVKITNSPTRINTSSPTKAGSNTPTSTDAPSRSISTSDPTNTPTLSELRTSSPTSSVEHDSSAPTVTVNNTLPPSMDSSVIPTIHPTNKPTNEMNSTNAPSVVFGVNPSDSLIPSAVPTTEDDKKGKKGKGKGKGKGKKEKGEKKEKKGKKDKKEKDGGNKGKRTLIETMTTKNNKHSSLRGK